MNLEIITKALILYFNMKEIFKKRKCSIPTVPRKTTQYSLGDTEFILFYFMREVERLKYERGNKVEIKMFSFLVIGYLSWDKPKEKLVIFSGTEK